MNRQSHLVQVEPPKQTIQAVQTAETGDAGIPQIAETGDTGGPDRRNRPDGLWLLGTNIPRRPIALEASPLGLKVVLDTPLQ